MHIYTIKIWNQAYLQNNAFENCKEMNKKLNKTDWNSLIFSFKIFFISEMRFFIYFNVSNAVNSSLQRKCTKDNHKRKKYHSVKTTNANKNSYSYIFRYLPSCRVGHGKKYLAKWLLNIQGVKKSIKTIALIFFLIVKLKWRYAHSWKIKIINDI